MRAIQSFAMSLLERRPTCGAGMDPPSVHEVVRESRFLVSVSSAQVRLVLIGDS